MGPLVSGTRGHQLSRPRWSHSQGSGCRERTRVFDSWGTTAGLAPRPPVEISYVTWKIPLLCGTFCPEWRGPHWPSPPHPSPTTHSWPGGLGRQRQGASCQESPCHWPRVPHRLGNARHRSDLCPQPHRLQGISPADHIRPRAPHPSCISLRRHSVSPVGRGRTQQASGARRWQCDCGEPGHWSCVLCGSDVLAGTEHTVIHNVVKGGHTSWLPSPVPHAPTLGKDRCAHHENAPCHTCWAPWGFMGAPGNLGMGTRTGQHSQAVWGWAVSAGGRLPTSDACCSFLSVSQEDVNTLRFVSPGLGSVLVGRPAFLLCLVLPAVLDSVDELTAPKGAGMHCGRQGCGAREGQRCSQK